ncbi:MAG TPA: fimbria/pilus outer membrane usher protein [Thermoanaerobaculia bacterium]|nr:fimbria/pilus outer membrane usher protein [Thermoanaerobaculia bacterium]
MMKTLRLAAMALLWPLIIFAAAEEELPVRVRVNGAEQGDFVVRRERNGAMMMRAADLRAFGLGGPALLHLPDDQFVSIRAVSPEIRQGFNAATVTLDLLIPPKLLPRQNLELGVPRSQVPLARRKSALLNYQLTNRRNSRDGTSTWELPWELSARTGNWLAFSTFVAKQNSQQRRMTRAISNLNWDDPNRMMRFVAGDFFAQTGDLGAAGRFAGMSLSKNFDLSPLFIRFPGLDLGGFLESPSEVEVWVNGALLRREQLSAGAFQLGNLVPMTGSGTVTLRIRDAFGRTRILDYPYYSGISLLAPGLHDYSYNIGYTRQDRIDGTPQYGRKPAFLAFHRMGITRRFTGGYRLEATENRQSGGLTGAFVLGRIGQISTVMAASRDKGTNGYGGALRYLFQGRHFGALLSTARFTQPYVNLSTTDERIKAQHDLQVTSHLRSANVSVRFSEIDRYNLPSRRNAGLILTMPLFRRMSLLASTSRDLIAKKPGDSLLLLTIPLGHGHFSTSRMSVDPDSRKTFSTRLENQIPLGTGISYIVESERTPDSLTSRQASVDYRGNRGIIGVAVQDRQGTAQYDLHAAGSIVWIDGGLVLGRPVQEGFAVVSVSDLQGVKVLQRSQVIGVTAAGSKLLVPSMIPYYEEQLDIQTPDLPLEYSVTNTSRSLRVPYRGGDVITFDVMKLRALEGTIVRAVAGRQVPVALSELKIETPAGVVTSVTGRGGEFYLEGLRPGRYRVTASQEGYSPCRFVLVVPETEGISSVGSLPCI